PSGTCRSSSSACPPGLANSTPFWSIGAAARPATQAAINSSCFIEQILSGPVAYSQNPGAKDHIESWDFHRFAEAAGLNLLTESGTRYKSHSGTRESPP